MSERPAESSVASKLACYSGIAFICLPIIVSAFNLWLPIWTAIIIGIILGTPLLMLGFRLHPTAASEERKAKSFWPTQPESWGMLRILTLLAIAIIPFAMFSLLYIFMPPGDNMENVVFRILTVGSVCFATIWWVGFAAKTFAPSFQDRLSDDVQQPFTFEILRDQSTTATAAARKNLHLALIAVVGFCIAFNVINLNVAQLNFILGPRRAQGPIRLLDWCRGNPNTTTSASVVVGVVTTILYLIRIRNAAQRGRRTAIRAE